jgi:excisionase family DNA binding protein
MQRHETSGYVEPRPDRLLSEEATRAQLGGISRATLFRLRQRGEIASVRIGRRVLFRVTDVDDYVERHRERAMSP